MNDILLGWGGMVGLVHGGMLGALDSEICSMVNFFLWWALDIETMLVIC